MRREYKERRLYFNNDCDKCGKIFQSFKRSRVKGGLCRNCRRIQADPNQPTLFIEQQNI